MTLRPDPDDFAFEAFLREQEGKSLLRFIACGSVDHGKSTLIGRLLYEAQLICQDQLGVIETDSRRHGTQNGELDFSLLLDGLAAEREQKITIDVAYRFFSTARRKFIVADAPGHEQYTRNMATGASTADLALVLVNAKTGLTRQTKRHSLIVSSLGVRTFVVAVNKMDLVGWSEQAFRAIQAEFHSLAKALELNQIVCIPISARDGDNLVDRSSRTDWYTGPTLLDCLEQVEVAPSPRRQPFRMPVQWVNRPTSDFRGYSGMIAGGNVYPGMDVQVFPSGQKTSIERIVTFDGDLEQSGVGRSVTLTLKDEVDVSRGDVIAGVGRPPAATDRLGARIVWLGQDPLAPGQSYLIKLGAAMAKAIVQSPVRVLDLDTRQLTVADHLASNDIGECVLRLDRLVAADPFWEIKDTGSFILIDPESFDTVAMGMVSAVSTQASQAKQGQNVRELPWFERLRNFFAASGSH
jgi:sulfate adenylyltransferase large subunit